MRIRRELLTFLFCGRDQTILKLMSTGVRGPADDDDAAIGAREERLERVTAAAEVGLHGAGIHAERVERERCVLLHGVPDVAELRVEDDGHLWRHIANHPHGCIECPEALCAMLEVKGEIRLVGQGSGSCCGHDAAIERDDDVAPTFSEARFCFFLVLREEMPRELVAVAVESDAHALAHLPTGFELFTEG